jgi:hypothetical protein
VPHGYGRRKTDDDSFRKFVGGLRSPTGYLTKCQDTCNIKVLALVSTGFNPGLVTVNLESWHLTCSAPPTANGEALRQKAYARSVPILPVPLDSSKNGACFCNRVGSYSRSGTPARSDASVLVPSSFVRAFPDSVRSCLLSNRCTVVHHAGTLEIAARTIQRAFRQMMVGVRNPSPQRPPVFLFS